MIFVYYVGDGDFIMMEQVMRQDQDGMKHGLC
jgi:hypothetical protein